MINLIRGFKDILPDEIELWQRIQRIATELFEAFGYDEIRIPIIHSANDMIARYTRTHLN